MTAGEVLARRERDGWNELPSAHRRGLLSNVFALVREPMTLLLLVCGGVYMAVHIHRSLDRDGGPTKSTKTGSPRRFNVEPSALPLLRKMHEERTGDAAVFERMLRHRDVSVSGSSACVSVCCPGVNGTAACPTTNQCP